jgi:hypothetical protein
MESSLHIYLFPLQGTVGENDDLQRMMSKLIGTSWATGNIKAEIFPGFCVWLYGLVQSSSKPPG